MSTYECIFCPMVQEYVTLTNLFSKDVSATLSVPIAAIFAALVSVVVAFIGIGIIMGRYDTKRIVLDFSYIGISASLLALSPETIVNVVYSATLSAIGGAAASIMTVGPMASNIGISLDAATAGGGSEIPGLSGMYLLVMAAELGIFKLFTVAGVLWDQGSVLSNPFPLVAGILMALPYALLLVLYTAQVLVCIFRVLIIALFSPIIIMFIGFNFLRSMAWSGIQTLLASFMVLLASTAALAVCLYGVAALKIDDPTTASQIAEMTEPTNARLWLVIIMGWVGFAFQTEGVSIANSIVKTSLSNTAAAMITGGVSATAGLMASHASKPLKNFAKNAAPHISDGIDAVRGNPVRSLRQKVDNPGIDEG